MAAKPPSPPSTPPKTSSPPSTLSDQPSSTSPTSTSSLPLSFDIRPDLLVPAPTTPTTFSTPIKLSKLITIRPTEDCKGLGVFALRDIEPGSVILFEEPLLVVPRSVSSPDMADIPSLDPLDELVSALSPTAREIWDGLCAYKREEGESGNRARLWSNGYSIREDSETGVFGTGSRVNHCCVPNCVFEWREPPLTQKPADEKGEGGRGANGEGGDEKGKGGLLIWNSWKILEGEEITVDYGHNARGREEWYGFVCGCGGCTDGESEDEDGEGYGDGEVDG